MTEYLFPEDGEFKLESFEEMSSRYSGFGEGLFTRLSTDEPNIFNITKFYKRTDSQANDSYAIIANINNSIAIQLDPDCEVIILWDSNSQIEKGNWTENLLYETIKSIKLLLMMNK